MFRTTNIKYNTTSHTHTFSFDGRRTLGPHKRPFCAPARGQVATIAMKRKGFRGWKTEEIKEKHRKREKREEKKQS